MPLPTKPAESSDPNQPKKPSFDSAPEVVLKEYDENSLPENLFRERIAKPVTGRITSEDLMTRDVSEFAQYDGIVENTIAWLQTFLREQNKLEELAVARDERGEKYDVMYATLKGALTKYLAREQAISNPEASVIIMSRVLDEMLGLGPIEPLYKDDSITEIMVNGHNRIRIEQGGILKTVKGCRFKDEEHLLELCRKMLNASGGRVIDNAHPMEDGRLPDQSRINVTHPVIGNKKVYLTIRRFRDRAFSLEELVNMGAMNEEMAFELGNLIHAGVSVVVSGGTGSGKTTMLNALSGCIPEIERVITIEDNIELKLHPKRDVVSLEARKGAQDEKKNVTIRDLVRNALRMRPDRIVVGEVRDGSAYDMLQAMNTGHDGSMTTVHANDAHGAIDRLVNLMSETGDLDLTRALALIAGGIDVIVTVQRYEDGSRRLSGVYEIPNRVTVINGTPTLEPITIWEYQQTGIETYMDGDIEREKIIGEYVKVNELSDSMINKHRLNKKAKLPINEIYRIANPNLEETA